MGKFIGILFGALLMVSAVSLADSSGGESLKQVKSKEVCMVNDTFFGRDQIPVVVGKTTYYGCCENCKKTLKDDKNSRVAVDPVSKKRVDKAKAVIGASSNGKVYYFENQKNLKNFRTTGK